MTHDSQAKILGVGVKTITLEQALDRIEGFIASGRPHYVCFSNVHTVMMTQSDMEFRRITNEADLALPDGMALVWAARLLGHDQKERI